MLFDKKCSASLLPQPLPERGACGVGTLAVEKVDPAPVALVAVQGAQAVAVQRFLKKEKQPGIVRFQAASDAGGGGRTNTDCCSIQQSTAFCT